VHCKRQHSSKACLYKALDALLPGLVLQVKLLCSSTLLSCFHPTPPEAVLDIQSVEVHCRRPLGLVKLLLSSLLLHLSLFMLCMLRHAVPGLHDAVLPEEQVEGDSNVL